MSKLLVSVRSLDEAQDALHAGADLIDIKEPSAGSLGSATEETIRDILRNISGKVPVSAALGEWKDFEEIKLPNLDGLKFVKFGLAGLSDDFVEQIESIRYAVDGPEPVLCSYVDWERALAPPVDLLIEFATIFRFPVFLFDTAIKDGQTILDHLPPEQLAYYIEVLKSSNIRIAVAGSLNTEIIQQLKPIEPDWFAVRGAVCEGNRRDLKISPHKITELKSILAN